MPSGACDIKGFNGVYFTPQDGAYPGIVINAETGGVWFCSIGEALDAGYVPH